MAKLEDRTFSKEWATRVLRDWFEANEFDPNTTSVTDVQTTFNSLQGLLSTTYIVDVTFQPNLENGANASEENGGNKSADPEVKSIFVKIPLRDGQNILYDSANTRESVMFSKILPTLQNFMDTKCDDVLRLPIPEIVFCSYTGDEETDVFILENLIASGFTVFKEEHYNKEYLKSCLECLAQLHGTSMAYRIHKSKKSSDIKIITEDKTEKSEKNIEAHQVNFNMLFPDLEEQRTIQEVLNNKARRKCVRRNLLPFLKYLEIQDNSIANYTGYLSKMEGNFFKILKRAEESGISKLVSLCHGDSKPDNFMFRKIEIDLDELSCEGLEAILIDWQQAFIGSVSNDLMWLLPPFLEQQKENGCTQSFALDYYYNQLKHVLTSFGKSLSDLGLEVPSEQFQKVLRTGFMLEFINVVLINPITQLGNEGPKLRRWYRKMVRYQERKSVGRRVKMPEPPATSEILPSSQFTKFANLYFKVAFVLGVFQEMGGINVELVREKMFREEGEKEEEEENDDVYSDEELPLTEEEYEEEEEEDEANVVVAGAEANATPAVSQGLLQQLVTWILGLFGYCNKKST